MKDYYDEEESYFAPPCNTCKHRHKNMSDKPCCHCCHNTMATPEDE